MDKSRFAQRRAGELACWETGAGETLVVIADGDGPPTPAHALLAERRRVIVFAPPAPEDAARRLLGALSAMRVGRFDVLGEGSGAAAALRLALAPDAEIGAIVLAAPDGQPDDAARDIERPVLLLSGTNSESDAGERWRRALPGCHGMFVYDAGRAIGAERPQALAYIVSEFLERRDLFLVSRESGIVFP